MDNLPDDVIAAVMKILATMGSIKALCATSKRYGEIEEQIHYDKVSSNAALSWILERSDQIRNFEVDKTTVWDIDEDDILDLIDIGFVDSFDFDNFDADSIPKRCKTRAVYLKCVSKRPHFLRFVPDNIRDEAFDNEAVHGDGWTFGYLNDAAKTEELLISVIKTGDFWDPAMLQEDWAVPARLLTSAVLEAAVHEDAWSFKYLDDEAKTEELLISVIKSGKNWKATMLQEDWKVVPARLRTPAVYEADLRRKQEEEIKLSNLLAEWENWKKIRTKN